MLSTPTRCPVQGAGSETKFADACCDVMRNVYHHFDDPPTMNASILRSLKQAGGWPSSIHASADAGQRKPAGPSG